MDKEIQNDILSCMDAIPIICRELVNTSKGFFKSENELREGICLTDLIAEEPVFEITELVVRDIKQGIEYKIVDPNNAIKEYKKS